MIVKENITVYICQHCKKRYFRKAACENHEVKCYSNPENFRACSSCQFMEETEVEYERDCRTLGDGLGVIETTETRKAKAFRCTKLDKIMYPFKAEAKGLPDKYPESFENQTAMPKVGQCDHFKMYGIS